MEKFYENKKVFITGGTGFLGRVFIEKILRSTDIDCIYVIIRPKKTQSPEERITQMFNDDLFENLQQLKPKARERIVPILGDFTLPRLGLSPEDYTTLVANVNVIVHCGATVRFEEPLHTAITINVRATNDLLELAKEMWQLEAFVHVSSAYANCPESYIEEKFYPDILGISADTALKMIELLGPKLTNAFRKELLNEFPNTYTFTKALAEDLVRTRGAELPICIFRPAIITSTYKEPIIGWTNNFLGPISITFPIVYGLLRIVFIRSDIRAQLVPVDFCANFMIACAWHTAKAAKAKPTAMDLNENATTALTTKSEAPIIYNYTPSRQNILNWTEYIKNVLTNIPEYSFAKMLYFPFYVECHSVFLYKLFSFIFDIVPNYIFDMYAALCGKEKRLLKLYNKFRKATDTMDYFKTRNWVYVMRNTNNLWSLLTQEEKNKFNFHMAALFWPEYIRSSFAGMRLYLAKDKPDSLPKAREHAIRLLKIHRIVKGLLYTILLLLLIWLLQVLMSYL